MGQTKSSKVSLNTRWIWQAALSGQWVDVVPYASQRAALEGSYRASAMADTLAGGISWGQASPLMRLTRRTVEGK